MSCLQIKRIPSTKFFLKKIIIIRIVYFGGFSKVSTFINFLTQNKTVPFLKGPPHVYLCGVDQLPLFHVSLYLPSSISFSFSFSFFVELKAFKALGVKDGEPFEDVFTWFSCIGCGD
jgi:hypothetical protein